MGWFSKLFGGTDKPSQQRSGPISPEEMAAYYRKALSLIGGGPGAYKGLTGGDYDELERMLSKAGLRRLGVERGTRQKEFMSRMRDIGMGDDPAADKLWGETGEREYAGAMSDLLSGASTQRYGMQLQETMGSAQMERDYWLNKMRMYYAGKGQYGQGTGATQYGGIIPALSGMASFHFGKK